MTGTGAPPATPSAGPRRTRSWRTSGPWPLWWVPVAAATGLALGAVGPDLAALSGYRTLGPVASVGQPIVRILALGAAATAVAGLLTAVVHAPGRRPGTLSPAGYAGLRTVRRACAVLAVAGPTVGLLTVAETIGLRPAALLADPPTLVTAMLAVEPAAGWAVTAVVAALVGVLAGGVLTWRGAAGLLVLLLAALAAPPATAVAGSERAHDWYGDALTLHVLAAMLWSGSVLAVAGLLRAGAVDAAALRRHDRIALGSAVVLLLSGVVPAALDAGPGALTTGPGLLVVASTALLAGGLVAIRRRRRTGTVARLLGVEAVVLMAATAAGTAMTRLPPATTEVTESARLVYLLGYDLPARMGAAELLGWWRVDLVFAPASLLAAAGYLLAVRRLRRAGGSWPAARTAAWTAGCAVVLGATSSGIGAFAPAAFSAHQLGHALLATVAPLLLVLGHPLTLVRAAAPGDTADRLTALLAGAPLRALNQPPVAWGVAAAAVFGVYATGLFDAVVDTHWAHPAMDLLALATGLALFRAVLGARDPEPPAVVRLGLLFAVAALHAAFAIWVLTRPEPLAGPFYAALALPSVPDLLADQRRGAVLAWVVSDAAMAVTALVVARSWTAEEPGTVHRFREEVRR